VALASGECHATDGLWRRPISSWPGLVGRFSKPTARLPNPIGTVSVDMGQTACKVPVDTQYIEKIEAAGRVGKKRKTMKC